MLLSRFPWWQVNRVVSQRPLSAACMRTCWIITASLTQRFGMNGLRAVRR
jgi:hypothetical protein